MCNYAFPPKKPLDLNLDKEDIFKSRRISTDSPQGLAGAGSAHPLDRIRHLHEAIKEARDEIEYLRLKEELLTLKLKASRHRDTVANLQKQLGE